MLTPPAICRAVAAALSWAAQGEAAGKAHTKPITAHSTAGLAMPASIALQERRIDVGASSAFFRLLVHRFARAKIILMQIAAFASTAKVAAAVAAFATACRRLQ